MNARLITASILCLSLAACAVPNDAGTGASGSSSSGSGAVAERYVDPKCQLSGCSAQICQGIDEEPMASDCMFRPTYECYKSARCEPQATGECGWTMTPELSACLLNPPEEDPLTAS